MNSIDLTKAHARPIDGSKYHYHLRCLKCGNSTQHKSQLCPACRTRKCKLEGCENEFVLKKNMSQRYCQKHRNRSKTEMFWNS